MFIVDESKKTELILSICDRITEKLPGELATTCCQFAKTLLSSIAYEDIIARAEDDVYGAVMTYWNFIQSRDTRVKLEFLNPDFERHGWTSSHTIIMLLTTDKPFLVESLRIALDRLDLLTHLTIGLDGLPVKRDDAGQLTNLATVNKAKKGYLREAPVFFEINRQTEPEVLIKVEETIKCVIQDVEYAVNDWRSMRGRLEGIITKLNQQGHEETVAFLQWLYDEHFTFTGARDYIFEEVDGERQLNVVPDSGLGVLRHKDNARISAHYQNLSPEARARYTNSQPILLSKTSERSTIHRAVYSDHIDIKEFDANGQCIAVHRFIGTLTAPAYHQLPRDIPMVREKINYAIERSELGVETHAGKVLLNIIETMPRDDLIQASAADIHRLGMGVYHLQDRRKIRMFAREDIFQQFISCMVFVPRERFSTLLRIAMQNALRDYFSAREVNFATNFSESALARIDFVIHMSSDSHGPYDLKAIENKLIEIGRSWEDDLDVLIDDTFGDEEGPRINQEYLNAFPIAYTEDYSPRIAVHDIKHMSKLTSDNKIELNFYRPIDDTRSIIRLKLYRRDKTMPLSDVLPILENMGLHIISERPYEIKVSSGARIWINDFGMTHPNIENLNVDELRQAFQTAFIKIWFGDVENDAFNQLVLLAGLTWREVLILRAYAKYFRQAAFTFSQDYIEQTLINNYKIVKSLVDLFTCQFQPEDNPNRLQDSEQIEAQLKQAFDAVENLDEDRILRHYFAVIKATLRTNYYQVTKDGQSKSYLSLKFNPDKIPDLPLPRPMFEIFVYSPRFEGVHLRSGAVARGGLRWSDRREDFRTEVLGLMKAQKVKNAVIVPAGAKGGFVPKQLPDTGDREAIMAEGIACYKNFIRGLLDITDNTLQGEMIKPENCVCHDEDDPYLVVAADKGTATFSDIANEIAIQYNFWLGDAFASGGSVGYDHKKMGITARGAWESVKRHFREMGKDCQRESFTVVGIGDMAGDVFGNGMLLSRQIKLVGAYNHRHIFLDPNPNPETSFVERERLFNLPRSSWSDYNTELLSTGGGIFDRNAKSVKLNKEIKSLLKLEQDFIVPNDLIKAMLRSPVDLLWNGGIGTFVKSDEEHHSQVGDRTNDGIRINASELRSKVVGEGGNLGFTQLARVQYALQGGRIYTDSVDNAGGVDCSDHEVNLKILLNQMIINGDMTEKQRNQLLFDMTDEVASLVLNNNYQQTQAISIANSLASKHVQLHIRYMQDLEDSGVLDRNLEFLPDEKELKSRMLQGRGLVSPGISTLMAYSKIILKEAILVSDVPEDPYFSGILATAFPSIIRDKYRIPLESHPLKREIIGTQLSNQLINEVGFTFVYRLKDETGATVPAIVKAYTIARALINIDEYWQGIQSLDNKISAADQNRMLMYVIRLVRRASRWLLRNRRANLDINETLTRYQQGIHALKQSMPMWLDQVSLKKYEKLVNKNIALGMTAPLASKFATINWLFPALDLVEISHTLGISVEEATKVYFTVGEQLQITWLRRQVIEHAVDSHWEALFREALRDDLDWQQSELTKCILRFPSIAKEHEKRIDTWSQTYPNLVNRWQRMLKELLASPSINYTMLFVSNRELMDLTHTATQAQIKPEKNDG